MMDAHLTKEQLGRLHNLTGQPMRIVKLSELASDLTKSVEIYGDCAVGVVCQVRIPPGGSMNNRNDRYIIVDEETARFIFGGGIWEL